VIAGLYLEPIQVEFSIVWILKMCGAYIMGGLCPGSIWKVP
jgi:hypothetical protein